MYLHVTRDTELDSTYEDMDVPVHNTLLDTEDLAFVGVMQAADVEVENALWQDTLDRCDPDVFMPSWEDIITARLATIVHELEDQS